MAFPYSIFLWSMGMLASKPSCTAMAAAIAFFALSSSCVGRETVRYPGIGPLLFGYSLAPFGMGIASKKILGHLCWLPLFVLAQGFCFLPHALVGLALHATFVWGPHGLRVPLWCVRLLHLNNVVCRRGLLPSVRRLHFSFTLCATFALQTSGRMVTQWLQRAASLVPAAASGAA